MRLLPVATVIAVIAIAPAPELQAAELGERVLTAPSETKTIRRRHDGKSRLHLLRTGRAKIFDNSKRNQRLEEISPRPRSSGGASLLERLLDGG
ncbi:MAG: hypothetical protein AAGC81_15700 [Pseudomonadota bacterium]